MREVEVHIVLYLKLFSSYFVLTYDIKSFWTNITSAGLLDFGWENKLETQNCKKYHAITRHANQIRNFFAQMLSVYETLNRGLQRQKQRQILNTLASDVLFICKTKNRRKRKRTCSDGYWLAKTWLCDFLECISIIHS